MTTTIGELEGEVLEILQKSPGYSGFYTAKKVRMAIQECFDYVSSWMFDSETGNWLEDIIYKDTTAGDSVIPIDEDIAMIKVVRYKVNTLYVPLHYDKDDNSLQTSPGDGIEQYPSKYRLVGPNLYFNPPLAEGGSKYLQLEVTKFPQKFTGKSDAINPQFHRAFQHYIKYRTASALVAFKQSQAIPWARMELEWKERIVVLIGKRINAPGIIREYEG